MSPWAEHSKMENDVGNFSLKEQKKCTWGYRNGSWVTVKMWELNKISSTFLKSYTLKGRGDLGVRKKEELERYFV